MANPLFFETIPASAIVFALLIMLVLAACVLGLVSFVLSFWMKKDQARIRLDRKGVCEQYFLSNNIGNHHIILFGRHAQQLQELCQSMGVRVRE